MHPWLIPSWNIPTYGVCLVAGVIVGWLLARLSAGRMGLAAERFDLMMPWVVGAGIAGAWLFGRATDAFTHLPWGTTGYVAVGGMVAGTLAGIAYAVIGKIRLGVLGDIAAMPIAVVMVFGRLGCFMAGCCYGKACDDDAIGHTIGLRFGPGSIAYADEVARGVVESGDEGLRVWPTQLIEMAGCFVLALILWRVAERIRRGKGISGEAFLTLGLGYGLLRFANEFLRGDNPPVLLGLTFSQTVCLGLMLAAGVTWWWRRKYLEKPQRFHEKGAEKW